MRRLGPSSALSLSSGRAGARCAKSSRVDPNVRRGATSRGLGGGKPRRVGCEAEAWGVPCRGSSGAKPRLGGSEAAASAAPSRGLVGEKRRLRRCQAEAWWVTSRGLPGVKLRLARCEAEACQVRSPGLAGGKLRLGGWEAEAWRVRSRGFPGVKPWLARGEAVARGARAYGMWPDGVARRRFLRTAPPVASPRSTAATLHPGSADPTAHPPPSETPCPCPAPAPDPVSEPEPPTHLLSTHVAPPVQPGHVVMPHELSNVPHSPWQPTPQDCGSQSPHWSVAPHPSGCAAQLKGFAWRSAAHVVGTQPSWSLPASKGT